MAATIDGFVRDSVSTDPLPFANVVLRGTDYGTATDKNGYYVIQHIPAGRYRIAVSYIGYAPADTLIGVAAAENRRVDLYLRPRSLQGEEVVVTANRQRFEEMVETSRINLTPRELEVVPAFVEADIFRSVQMLPGVVAQNDFSAALVVRGGSPDENLILLDGVEVYNPYHFGGIFSAFNTDAIRDAEFQSGGFPVRYGGRLSSVLEISTKEGNPSGGFLGKKWPLTKYWDISGINLDLSLLSSKALIQGPFYKGSYIFSGRRTYFDQLSRLAHAANDRIPELPYYFYDLQWKVHSQVTPVHRLDVQGYTGADDLTLHIGDLGDQSQTADLNWVWGNTTSGAVLKSILRPGLILTSMVSGSRYDFDVDFARTVTDSLGNEVTDRFVIRNLLHDLTLAEKADWKASPAHRVQLGAEYKRFRFRFALDNNDSRILDETEQPVLASGYAQDTWRLSPVFNVQMGVRGSYYSLSDRPWFDLRGGIKYRPYVNTALKLSAGSYTQFLFTSNQDDAVLRVVDFWNAVPSYLDPERAMQYIAGIEQWIGEGYHLSLEGYYKPYLNIIDMNPLQKVYDQEDDFIQGTGVAWGLEALFKKSVGNLTGWISYSYARVRKRIDLDGDGVIEPDRGEVYPPKYDKRHNLNLVLSYRINDTHSVGFSWNWSSGEPYTPVIGKQYGGSGTSGWFQPYQYQTNIEGDRNSAYFPAYLRGDLSYTRKIRWFHREGEFKFQLINFTNHFNVLLYQWDHSKSPSSVTATSMFPIIPTVGISLKL